MDDLPIVIAAASRPHVHETTNGDGWTWSWHAGAYRIAVVDGLGHGPEAASATRLAIEALAAQPELPPGEAVHACHDALRGTRGAAMAIAQFNLKASRLNYAAVGNVEARLWQPEGWQRPIAYRGIVGAILPTIRVFDFPLGGDWLLLLHTDGVSARCDPDALPSHLRQEPQALADTLLDRWGQPRDDATVVVARRRGA